MIVLGIDIGISGAIAISRDGAAPSVHDMPVMYAGKTGRKRIDADALRTIIWPHTVCRGEQPIAYVEDVHATPQMGVSSAFSFGRALGVVEGALAALGIEVRYVRPQKWKAALGLDRDKAKSLELARRLYPGLGEQLKRVKDDGRAEALLIAWYGAEQIEQRVSVADLDWRDKAGR